MSDKLEKATVQDVAVAFTNRCETCKYARKAGADDVVACSFWQKTAWDNDLTNQELVNSDLFNEKLEYLAEGWAYLNCRPDWEHEGILGRGMMTNFVILSKREALCSKFELYKG